MSVEEFVLQNRIKKLGRLFALMVDNYNTMGAWWKNIPLGKEAFELMKRLPERVEGEFDSPAEKAGLLEQMLGQMVEKASPRFCIEVRRYICVLAPDDTHNAARLGMLRDYIDLDYPMDDFCSGVLTKRRVAWASVLHIGRSSDRCLPSTALIGNLLRR